MLRKFSVAGLIAGAAIGAALVAAPASAGSHGGDQQFNQNLQLTPTQTCESVLPVLGDEGLLVNLPILSPQSGGDCVNGPVFTNID